MKAAVVSAHASPLTDGGASGAGQSIQVAEVAEALARCGHEVTVYTRRDRPDRPERVVVRPGYSIVHLDAGPSEILSEEGFLEYAGDFGRTLAARWENDPPDVAHAYSWTSGIATELAARNNTIPTVQTFRVLEAMKRRYQPSLDTAPNTRVKLEKLVARHATWIAAVSTEELGAAMRMGRPRSQMSVIPCGVDVQRFATDGPRADRTDRPRLLSVGNPLPHNGFDTLIVALGGIPDAELVIVGGPDAGLVHADRQARRLTEIAARLGVADRVALTGGVPHHEMPALLRSADVVLCTPWYEGSPMVALEAMACGVPVIASDVGGLRDTIVPDVTGRLVKPRSPRAVAKAASTILHDPFLRRSLGHAGRDRVCARYTWDAIGEQTAQIYRRLVSTRAESQAFLVALGHPTVQGSADI